MYWADQKAWHQYHQHYGSGYYPAKVKLKKSDNEIFYWHFGTGQEATLQDDQR
jgi:hypothetical protein